MTKLRVHTFTAQLPTNGNQQRVPTYGSGKRPQHELEALAKSESHSYIRVVKPQYLDASIEQGTEAFYKSSRSHLNALVAACALQEIQDAMFLYEQSQPNLPPLRGVILSVDLAHCINGSVKKHENVLESKSARLVRHIEVLGSISEPVLLTQKLPANIKSWLHAPRESEPLMENHDHLGFAHRLWLLNAEEIHLVKSGFAELSDLYIADGHHRVAAVSIYLESVASQTTEPLGLMSLVMDQNDLLIKSFHRVIKGVGDLDVESYLKENELCFEALELIPDSFPLANQALAMTQRGSYLFHLAPAPVNANAVDQLEVSRVEKGILKELFGIENTSNDSRISFMRGDTPLSEMRKMIDEGACDCVFVLPANSFDQVEAVADQHLTMPPKSTWVEPKLLTGFVSQKF